MKLARHLASRGWLGKARLPVRFDAADFGPFVSARKLAGPPAVVPAAELRTATDEIKHALLPPLETYAALCHERLREVSRCFRAWVGHLRGHLWQQVPDAVRFRDGSDVTVRAPMGGRHHFLRMISAHERLCEKITLPEAMRSQLIEVNDPILESDVLAIVDRVLGGEWMPENSDQNAPVPACTVATATCYDTFVSYRSSDGAMVRLLVSELAARGVRAWFDETEIKAGDLFQDMISAGLGASLSAVVVVGPDGFGNWQSLEARRCISECIERGIAVIPVLLPGVTEVPKSLSFLREFSYITFKSSVSDPESVDRLVAGIRTSPRLGPLITGRQGRPI
jgi:hypothetical protein